MKTAWDYTELAQAYLKRPDYSPQALSRLFAHLQLSEKALVCDVGAGVAHLTLELLRRNFEVVAVEPNDKMRALGIERTQAFKNIRWHEGTGEQTGQPEHHFDLVTFGSSFNVTDRQLALQETQRILKPGGWFACMWNHRDLQDPIQTEIESIICTHISAYKYGSRRENQTTLLEKSGLFESVEFLEGKIIYTQSLDDVVTAWKSHGTLQRQAGEKFAKVIQDISDYLHSLSQKQIQIPYTTRIWFGQIAA